MIAASPADQARLGTGALASGQLYCAPTSPKSNATALLPIIRKFEYDTQRGYQTDDGATSGFVEFVAVESKELQPKRLMYMVKDQMEELFGGGYLTRETATFVLDSAAYQVNYGYYIWLRFDFNFIPEGGVIPTFTTETLPAGTCCQNAADPGNCQTIDGVLPF